MPQHIVFVVSSIIHCSTNPLSYSQVRTVFTPEERAKQTIHTIESIRLKVPEASILLVETGLEHAPVQVRGRVDRYLYIGNRRLVRQAADGPHKGYGEAVSLVLANRQIQSLQPDYCFKLSGRYFLNEHFQIANWNQNYFTAKKGPGWFSTTLYGFPFSQYGLWRSSLKKAIPFLRQGEAIENAMWRLFPDAHHIETLGVSGIVAPWNLPVTL